MRKVTPALAGAVLCSALGARAKEPATDLEGDPRPGFHFTPGDPPAVRGRLIVCF